MNKKYFTSWPPINSLIYYQRNNRVILSKIISYGFGGVIIQPFNETIQR